jgi:hypothetical protein
VLLNDVAIQNRMLRGMNICFRDIAYAKTLLARKCHVNARRCDITNAVVLKCRLVRDDGCGSKYRRDLDDPIFRRRWIIREPVYTPSKLVASGALDAGACLAKNEVPMYRRCLRPVSIYLDRSPSPQERRRQVAEISIPMEFASSSRELRTV